MNAAEYRNDITNAGKTPRRLPTIREAVRLCAAFVTWTVFCFALVTLAAVLIAGGLGGCANTSQTLDADGVRTNSATMPTVATRALKQTNSVPTNVILLDSSGLASTDVGSSVLVGFSTTRNLLIEGQPPSDSYSVVFKIAQDARFKGARGEVTDADDDGAPERFTFTIDEYDGSGSASIVASGPLVQTWADLLRQLSADERDRFLKAMDTIDAAFAAAVRAAMAANGVP